MKSITNVKICAGLTFFQITVGFFCVCSDDVSGGRPFVQPLFQERVPRREERGRTSPIEDIFKVTIDRDVDKMDTLMDQWCLELKRNVLVRVYTLSHSTSFSPTVIRSWSILERQRGSVCCLPFPHCLFFQTCLLSTILGVFVRQKFSNYVCEFFFFFL